MSENSIKSNQRFVRWQQILREHLSFLNNLILTISVGILGFAFSLLKEDNFNPQSCQKLFLTVGLFSVAFSVIIGIATSLNRLFDFKTTVKKINDELNGNFSELEELKQLMGIYGKRTWCLFYFQLTLFIFGITNLTISFLMIYSDKLF